jgi:hypothetical protein
MDAPKHWDDVNMAIMRWNQSLLLNGLAKHDLKPEPETWEGLTRFFFDDESECRDEVDDLVRYFAKHDRAPESVTTRARFYFMARCLCAHDFTGMLFPTDAETSPFSAPPKGFSTNRLAEWVLIDLWHRRFDHWLKLSAIGYYGAFPFYGLTPAD